MEKKLLTVQEMAKVLRTPVSFLYSRTRQTGPNSIPVIRVGHYLRFEEDRVIEYFKKQQETERY